MKIFVAVVDASSFTGAANQISATPGVVSRAISELEDHLRTRLLHRTTRRLALTEAGTRYLRRCRDILASVAEAENEASAAHTQAAGTLRVIASAGIGQDYIVPALAAFQARYPELTIDLTLSHQTPDMLEDGHDVAILAAPNALPDSNFISHPLGVIDSVLCAAPRYIEHHGKPRTVEELDQHVCLPLAQPNAAADHWPLVGPDGERDYALPAGRFRVNLPDAMAAALREGVGIGALPVLAARSALRSGALVAVLPDYRVQRLNVYAVYASRKYLDAKIKNWIEFAREWFVEATGADRAGDALTAAERAPHPTHPAQPAHPAQAAERRVPRTVARRRDSAANDYTAAALPWQANGAVRPFWPRHAED